MKVANALESHGPYTLNLARAKKEKEGIWRRRYDSGVIAIWTWVQVPSPASPCWKTRGFIRVMLSTFSLSEDLVAVKVADIFELCIHSSAGFTFYFGYFWCIFVLALKELFCQMSARWAWNYWWWLNRCALRCARVDHAGDRAHSEGEHSQF